MKSIIESGRYERVEEDSEIFSEAFKLYALGHKDMIDNILYPSAVRLSLILLTLDDELKTFEATIVEGQVTYKSEDTNIAF